MSVGEYCTMHHDWHQVKLNFLYVCMSKGIQTQVKLYSYGFW